MRNRKKRQIVIESDSEDECQIKTDVAPKRKRVCLVDDDDDDSDYERKFSVEKSFKLVWKDKIIETKLSFVENAHVGEICFYCKY